MALQEIQVSRTEKFCRLGMFDPWTLHVVADNGVVFEVPQSSLLNNVLDMLALHIEHFDMVRALDTFSNERTCKLLQEAKLVVQGTILRNQALIKESN